MNQKMSAAEVAAYVGMPLELFKKLPYNRRPACQDDGTFLKTDVLEWRADRFIVQLTLLAQSSTSITCQIHELILRQRDVEKAFAAAAKQQTEFEIARRSEILMPRMPWFKR